MEQHYLMKYVVFNCLGVCILNTQGKVSGVSDWISGKFNLVCDTADSSLFDLGTE